MAAIGLKSLGVHTACSFNRLHQLVGPLGGNAHSRNFAFKNYSKKMLIKTTSGAMMNVETTKMCMVRRFAKLRV